jgi:hypothetical protein
MGILLPLGIGIRGQKMLGWMLFLAGLDAVVKIL